MYKIGIDPGQKGSLVVVKFNNNKNFTVKNIKNIQFYDFTTIKKNLNYNNIANPVSNLIDVYPMKKVLERVKNKQETYINIEKVHTMPLQGVSSSGNFMMNFGLLKGFLLGSGFKLNCISPQVWKRYYGLLKKIKDASRILAIDKFGDCNIYKEENKTVYDYLKYKKNVDRADALLIALYELI
jgi:hypothetical protein